MIRVQIDHKLTKYYINFYNSHENKYLIDTLYITNNILTL